MVIKLMFNNKISEKRQIEETVNIINSIQHFFYFDIENTFDLFTDAIMIDWDDFVNFYKDDEYRVIIVNAPFIDNWFSHGNNKISVITIADWAHNFSPPSLKSYLIYQIAKALIKFVLNIDELTEKNLFHYVSKGCLFDFCKKKDEIKLGMRAGMICPECKAKLFQYGMQSNILYNIENLLNYVRDEIIGNPSRINVKDVFIIMEYSYMDENYNAYLYGICEALKFLNLNCLRADSTIESSLILEKIKNMILESNFIIAKIDCKNLNVYFELGYALGLGKKILLLSNKDYIINLPSDLNNVECITYTKGNYVELKEKVIMYFERYIQNNILR